MVSDVALRGGVDVVGEIAGELFPVGFAVHVVLPSRSSR